MKNGTVKWFNPTKGYGFIQLDDEDKDVFIHITEVQRAGIPHLAEGQKVTFELATNKGKVSAVNIKLQ